MALRISGPREKLLACLLKAMKSSSEPYLYAILGETYDKMGDAAKANILFIMEACVAENGADKHITNLHVSTCWGSTLQGCSLSAGTVLKTKGVGTNFFSILEVCQNLLKFHMPTPPMWLNVPAIFSSNREKINLTHMHEKVHPIHACVTFFSLLVEKIGTF